MCDIRALETALTFVAFFRKGPTPCWAAFPWHLLLSTPAGYKGLNHFNNRRSHSHSLTSWYVTQFWTPESQAPIGSENHREWSLGCD